MLASTTAAAAITRTDGRRDGGVDLAHPPPGRRDGGRTSGRVGKPPWPPTPAAGCGEVGCGEVSCRAVDCEAVGWDGTSGARPSDVWAVHWPPSHQRRSAWP